MKKTIQRSLVLLAFVLTMAGSVWAVSASELLSSANALLSSAQSVVSAAKNCVLNGCSNPAGIVADFQALKPPVAALHVQRDAITDCDCPALDEAIRKLDEVMSLASGTLGHIDDQN